MIANAWLLAGLGLCLFVPLSPAAPIRGHYAALCPQAKMSAPTAADTPSAAGSLRSFPGCTVKVYAAGTQSAISLYSDPNGTPKANPFVADPGGSYDFFAEPQLVDIVLSGAGMSAPVTLRDREVISRSPTFRDISLSRYNCAGDGRVNDTACVQRALIAAGREQLPLYVPTGEYAICNVSLTTRSSISVFGDGPFASRFVRHSSCLQASTDMIAITGARWVTIHDLSFDMLTNGSNFRSAEVNLTGVGGADIYNDYFTHAQAVAVQYTRSDNLKFHDNYCYENWWLCLSAISGGTTARPSYNYNFNVSGNIFVNTYFGASFTAFLSGITVTGNVFNQSSLGIIQDPVAHAVVSGNAFSGIPSYGCSGTGLCPLSIYASIFGEGVEDASITGNDFVNTNWGIYLQGSYLQIPLNTGTITQLPIKRIRIGDNRLSGLTGSWSILVSGTSTNGTAGNQIGLTGDHIFDSSYGPNITGAENVSVMNEYVESMAYDCFTLSGVVAFEFSHNRAHNCGSALTGEYHGLVVSGVSHNGTVNNNSFIDDNGGYVMNEGVLDSTLTGGYASQIRHWNNVIVGVSVTAPDNWRSPTPGIPAPLTGSPNFEGSGLSDMTTGGSPTASGNNSLTIAIDSTGTPDTFKWSKNGGSYTTGVSITGSAQTITDGVTITFAAKTGHTLAANCPGASATGGCWTVGYTRSKQRKRNSVRPGKS